MDGITLLGLCAAALVVISFVPQAYKTYKTKSAKDFSWAYLAILLASQIMWAAYGLLISNLPITISNVCTTLLISVIIAVKYKYG
jgi:MtN3 and saliva related transmembrane protein